MTLLSLDQQLRHIRWVEMGIEYIAFRRFEGEHRGVEERVEGLRNTIVDHRYNLSDFSKAQCELVDASGTRYHGVPGGPLYFDSTSQTYSSKKHLAFDLSFRQGSGNGAPQFFYAGRGRELQERNPMLPPRHLMLRCFPIPPSTSTGGMVKNSVAIFDPLRDECACLALGNPVRFF
ncbi:hypothetical protein C8R44DRAFT_754161 [Mycena epipterygia]|nr:hypothetical protein C8R44DRAFT_754161 [Mycena epipterygia]